VAHGQNAAIVNGKPIPKAKLDEFMATFVQGGRPETAELRQAIRDELIARELFIQEAERRGLPRDTQIKQLLESARQDILIRALVRDELKKQPVTDAEVEAEYTKMTQGAGNKEYKARHILLATEAEALSVIEQLRKGAAFEELAKQSKDPGSATQGGDLDWNAPNTYVKPFAEALVRLEKGAYTDIPIQTDFGWHVIRLDDIRDAQVPALDQLKPQLRQELDRQRIMTLQQTLRKKAIIQ